MYGYAQKNDWVTWSKNSWVELFYATMVAIAAAGCFYYLTGAGNYFPSGVKTVGDLLTLLIVSLGVGITWPIWITVALIVTLWDTISTVVSLGL